MDTQQSAGLRQATWLSCGLETLVDCHRWMADSALPRPEYDFDVVIVGSGYGGAVAAAELTACTYMQGEGAGKSLKICVLERGKEYLSGMFPSRQADLPGHIRFTTPEAKRQRGIYGGLYDMRWSDDAVAVVASGVGGGSLINAGVMEMPKEYVFQESRWPTGIRKASRDGSLAEKADALRHWLGARKFSGKKPGKTKVLRKLAPKNVVSLHVTVASKDHANAAGVALAACSRCGDCAAGCNYNAKESLDLNLLHVAQQAGAQIVTGATVLRVEPGDAEDVDGQQTGKPAGWRIYVNHTDGHLRDRQPDPFCIRARYVILAAGTFGSTEILMRSRNERLQFSDQLGRKFSANGDMLVMAYGLEHEGNAVADEIVDPRPPGRGRPGRRAIGPTITEMIDLRKGHADTDLVIQDLAVPGPLRRLFEETTTTFDILNGLAGGDWKRHGTGPLCRDDAAVNPDAIKNSLVLAMICRDDAEGQLRLNGPTCDDADGLLTVSWPQLRLDRRFEAQHSRLRDLLQKSKLGGRVVNNLLWRPLSEDLEDVFGRQRGPLVTVHPLGGCAMGDNASHGVTDDCGRVFDVGKGGTYFGLVVLDGSIVPTSLGINPALTISVLALQALGKLKECWGIEGGRLDKKPEARKERGSARPTFSKTGTNSSPNPTLIELTEQVRGRRVKLSLPGVRPQRHEIEITLTTQPKEVATLFSRSAHAERCLIVPAASSERPAQGNLRILKAGIEFDPVSDEPCRADDVAFEAEISGKLKIFALEKSHPFWRTFRASYAWLFNRGLRDIVQGAFQRIGDWLRLAPRQDEEPKMKLPFRQQARSWLKEQWDWIRMNEEDGGPRNVVTIMRRLSLALLTVAAVVSVPVVAVLSRSVCYTLLSAAVVLVVLFAYRQRSYILKMFGLFSRAGAVRLIEYDLHIDKVTTSNSGFEKSMFEGQTIRGVKRLTYARGASPFTQLMVLSLEKFPGMRTFPGKKLPEMELNKRYLARQEVPLLRVVGQENGFASLVDMVSFAFYLVRVVLQVHALSFRKPDAPSTRPHQRLPVAVLGLPTPQIDWLTVDATTKPPARIRLARYDGSKWDGKKPSANQPQRPVLLIHGYSASGTTFVHHTVPGNLVQVLCEHGRDVWVLDLRSSAGLDTATADWTFEMMANQDIPAALGHVIAATGSPEGRVDVVAHCMGAAMLGMALLEDPDDPTKENCLHKKIGRVVFSQVGPAMLLSRTNVLAAYVMRYVRDLLPLEEYSFSPQGKVSTAGQFLDRALAAMSMTPYEFRRENPWWPAKATPWVGTRHRMDALYGRTFRLKNMANGTLDHIDDFFGPLSVDTVSQVLHFAAVNCVTNNRGINRYVTPERVADRLKFPMMSLHGKENGLADPATMAIMRNMLVHAGVPYLNDALDDPEPSGKDRAAKTRKFKEFVRNMLSHARVRYLNDILGGPEPSSKDRAAQTLSFEKIKELIQQSQPHLTPGQPSHLTWLIKDHGHQDCLIGKEARSVCEVIALYLGVPDPPSPDQLPTAQPGSANVPVSAVGGIS